MTASPTDDLTSAERRIQELIKELSQARGELSRAEGELVEARGQQAATAAILRLISGSPMDLKRVFAEMAASAADHCGAHDASIFQVDGDHLRLVGHHGPIPVLPVGDDTLPLTRGLAMGRAVLDRKTIHVADMQAEDDEYPESRARSIGFRTILSVPLVGAREVIGAIGIRRTEAKLFSDKQIALLETFANQAVIAIENTRLFEAEQASKRELQESLEYQTATSDVLNIISRSTTEVQPVFDAIVKSAAQLFDQCIIVISSLEGHQLIYRASASVRYERKVETEKSLFPIPFDPELSPASRAILEKRIVEIPDAAAAHAPEVTRRAQQALGLFRSVTYVPLIREGQGIGVIMLGHPEPGSKLSDKQVTLVQTFADQEPSSPSRTRGCSRPSKRASASCRSRSNTKRPRARY
jgi:GAF domain-containing protein